MNLAKLFLDHPEQEYGKPEAARAAKLAPATAYRIIRTLLTMDVVEERRIKKLRLYRMAQNRETKFLDELLAAKKSAIEEFVELASQVPGVMEIVQLGKPSKERVSILVIGENVDPVPIGRIETEIRTTYKFAILQTTLSPLQYEQMSGMGLYGGEKFTLYTRSAS